MAERSFQRLDVDQMWRIVARYRFTRRITEVHLHHTWKPRRSDYRGEETIRGMWRFHTQVQGWSDIAQHLSIAPDGAIWTGRAWDRAPASATGFNGNSTAGPFMIETIGNFDVGEDLLDGRQREAVVQTVAAVLVANGLKKSDVRFHNEMTTVKSCPGTGVDKDQLLREVAEAMKGAKEKLETSRAVRLPFSDDTLLEEDVLVALRAGSVRAIVGEEGELPEDGPGLAASPADERDLFGSPVTPEELSELAGHVINLNQGRLSIAGTFRSTVGQVQSIVDVHLRREVDRAIAQQRPVRIFFFAHGGLNSEGAALRRAADLLPWFLANQVFPIFFVWETGILETLRQLTVGGQREVGARGKVLDWTLEAIGRGPGRRIWGAMKQSAAAAVESPPPGGAPEEGGGALVLIEALSQFIAGGGLKGRPLEIHALGHSAGSNLHGYFLPALCDRLRAAVPAGPVVRELFLLAPAIAIADFARQLAPRLGADIAHSSMFTMQRAYEDADRSMLRYGGSLLVLISRVLEAQRDTPILGLQESHQDDPAMRTLFGIGAASPVGEVVYSPTALETGASASKATQHGAFDDDRSTMNAVMERVLGRPSAPAVAFERLVRKARELPSEAELVREAQSALWAGTPLEGWFDADSGGWQTSQPPAAPPWTPSLPSPAVATASGSGSAGRRRAITIGVDAYADPGDRLSGCVADARSWAETLRRLGFEVVDVLENSRAHRAGILAALGDLVGSATPGDVLAIHYSGHGTQVDDLDSDEEDDASDEAICPVDFRTGALIIDDDLDGVFQRLAPGVSCTVFLDCCHSGRGARVAVAINPADASTTARARFVPPTPELERAHREFRSQRALVRAAAPAGSRPYRVINFSACQSHEVAWEDHGQGEFTRRAVAVLAAGASMTNDAFQREVERQFGPAYRQRPLLDCAPEARDLTLLAPTLATGNRAVASAGQPGLAELLRQVARLVEG